MKERDLQAHRLLAHLKTTNTRWFKVSKVLLEIAIWRVPEHRDSYNPVQRLAGWIGGWMDDVQTKRTNRKFDQEWGLR